MYISQQLSIRPRTNHSVLGHQFELNTCRYCERHGYELILATQPVSNPSASPRSSGSGERKFSSSRSHTSPSSHSPLPLLDGVGDIDASRPAAWSKIRALRRHLDDFDYVSVRERLRELRAVDYCGIRSSFFFGGGYVLK